MFRAQQNAFDDAVGWFLPLPDCCSAPVHFGWAVLQTESLIYFFLQTCSQSDG